MGRGQLLRQLSGSPGWWGWGAGGRLVNSGREAFAKSSGISLHLTPPPSPGAPLVPEKDEAISGVGALRGP